MTGPAPDRGPTVGGGAATGDAELIDEAVELARRVLADSLTAATAAERRRGAHLGRLLADPDGRALTFALADEVVRIRDRRRSARRFHDVVTGLDLRRGVGRGERLLLRLGARLAPLAPRLVMPLVIARIRGELAGVVLPAGDPSFGRYVVRRRADGMRLNVNLLGEAILSDAEADERVRLLLERIARPDVDYVSVKISAIVANLDAIAFDDGVMRVSDRLRMLYRAAAATSPPTFVNLDMEDYSDLEMTVAAFTTVLDEPEFVTVDAGIVLQAYLPDSHDVLDFVGEWAARRHAAGGGTIKVRLVKGANLAMEHVESELRGWVAAPYATKEEVDASFKRMLDHALCSEWDGALRVGVASHNLFDVAWALVVARRHGVRQRIDLEMLEGMAPAQARRVREEAGDLLLYAPIVRADDTDASIAYLARRLDENTAPENFLHALFTLQPDTPAWHEQEARFRRAVAGRHRVATSRRRTALDPNATPGNFANQPDTDFTSPTTREQLAAALAMPDSDAPPLVATIGEIDDVIAGAAASSWSGVGRGERRRVLLAAAERMAGDRLATLSVMAAETAKTPREGDPEVSEAVDFARHHALVGLDRIDAIESDGVVATPHGVVVVAAPWNFPYAIPAGGVLAALAAGNAVVLKPAPEARRTAWWLARQLWAAGVPSDALHYVACDDGPVGRHLITHDGVATVVLTGSYDTARRFLDWRPAMRLFAETSGKNALVITATADLDAAIHDLVRSAFGHAGQKCSAASLAIVEASVHDAPSFQRRLADAVASVRVGPAADPATMMGPLVQPPGDALLRALTVLDPGERWLVEPRRAGPDERWWTPGVRMGVAAGSWFHVTECFGPVLGLLRADDLAHAIELQNATPFGLTGGLHALDPAEVEQWLDGVQVGNAYINRHITGAIVERQPFGGWKRSSIGGGTKPGGPGFVAQFCTFTDSGAPDDTVAGASYTRWWDDWFTVEHDPSGLAAERNVLRYVPIGGMVVRFAAATAPGQLALARLAARVTGVATTWSDADEESEAELLARLPGGVERLRLLCDASGELRRGCAAADVAISSAPFVSNGWVELGRWVREQAVSVTAHRHGRLTPSSGGPARLSTRRAGR